MIFVTIGMMYGFDRLIRKMDEIAGTIDEEIIMQTGEGKYEPINAKYFTFISKKDMDKLYNNARIVVCHSGVGSIISALEYNKPVVVVPRLQSYGEVIDGHQAEIAKELEERGKVKVVYDLEELDHILNNIKEEYNNFDNNEIILSKRLKEYINQLI